MVRWLCVDVRETQLAVKSLEEEPKPKRVFTISLGSRVPSEAILSSCLELN